ncbi:alpha/beta hydrolase-fold protein [Flavobacterium sp.]|uniref:alpha/beta hydrolase n=1 Tax=Flavobacterium sp. TaxID=239 RepID=UPI002617C17B|nr:alpha/beta hydrolase-fold protein [Flavobacterium sp.]
MSNKFLIILLSLLITACNNQAQQQEPIPTHDTFKINSKVIGETRTINVWFPEDYAKSKDSLPVMYMPDGGTAEDFPHIANTMNDLIKENKIPPFILVGIENTVRRRDLSGSTEVEKDKEIAPVIGGAPKFRAFIKDELFPEINKRYRTKNTKGIIGESLAGLFIMETFMTQPEMFDYYIAMDPSLWWNNHYLVRTAKEHLTKFPEGKKRLWFAGSSASDIAKHTKNLAKILTSENNKNVIFQYSNEPKEEHATIYRATKEKALIWTLNP